MIRSDFIKLYEELNLLTEAKQDAINFKQFFINSGATEEEAEHYLQKFIEFKPKLKSPENDYYYWTKKKSAEDFIKRLDELETAAITKQQQKASVESGAKLLKETDIYRVYHITTHDAAIKYGLGTKWCLTSEDPHYWNDYINNKKAEIYYYLPKAGKADYEKHALAVYPDKEYEIFNAADDPATGIPNAPQIEGLPQIETDPEFCEPIVDYTIYTLEVVGTNKQIRNKVDRYEDALADIKDFLAGLSKAELENVSLVWDNYLRLGHSDWVKSDPIVRICTALNAKLLYKGHRIRHKDLFAAKHLAMFLHRD